MEREVAVDAERYEALCSRSASLHASRQFEAALQLAQQALLIEPLSEGAHLRRGAALEGMGQYREAMKAYKFGLSANPDSKALSSACHELSALAQQLNHLNVSTKQTEPDPRIDALEVWLRQGGAKISDISIRESLKGVRGVYASTDISEGCQVLTIPRNYILYTELAKETLIGKSIVQSGIRLQSQHTFLACMLLQERGNPQSFWKPYLDTLPQYFGHAAINFSREELSYLTGSVVLRNIENRLISLRYEYENLLKHVPMMQQFSLEEFTWARTVVISRSFSLSIDGTKTEALIPMADFLNHSIVRSVVWSFNVSRDAFCMALVSHTPASSEITDSYGHKCNCRLLTNYGFALEENEDNEALIFLRLDPDDDSYEAKLSLLEESPELEVFVVASIDDYRFEQALSVCRFLNMTEEKLEQESHDSDFNFKKLESISVGNEVRALQTLKNAAVEAMQKFETSIEDDNAILGYDKLPTNIRNAIITRRGEKEVLRFIIDFVDEISPLFLMRKSDLQWIFKTCNCRQVGRFDQYILRRVRPLLIGSLHEAFE